MRHHPRRNKLFGWTHSSLDEIGPSVDFLVQVSELTTVTHLAFVCIQDLSIELHLLKSWSWVGLLEPNSRTALVTSLRLITTRAAASIGCVELLNSWRWLVSSLETLSNSNSFLYELRRFFNKRYLAIVSLINQVLLNKAWDHKPLSFSLCRPSLRDTEGGHVTSAHSITVVVRPRRECVDRLVLSLRLALG